MILLQPSSSDTTPPVTPDVLELTKKLINIPSISGDEAQICTFLENLLSTLGWKVERQEVAEGRHNLWVKSPEVPSPALVFNSHMDTVPPFFPCRENEEWIYGRGACDTKGSMAAQIFAAESLRQQGVHQVGLLLVVGEEEDHIGARLAGSWPKKPRAVIVAEPTEGRLVTSQKGMLRLRLESRGQPGHSGYPESGSSAWEPLLTTLHKLQKEPWPVHPSHGATTLNMGQVTSPNAANVISDFAAAELVFRVSTKAEDVLKRVRELLESDVDLEVMVSSDPLELDTVDGFPTTAVAYHTDLPYFDFAEKKYLWGAGSILYAHTMEERVRKSELISAVTSYQKLAHKVLSSLHPESL